LRGRSPPDAQRLFRLLGLVPGPDVTADAAAALAETTPDRATRLLDRLAGAHLLDQPTAGRYAFHDLLRLYAVERARHEHTAEEREAATWRLLSWSLSTADAAAALVYPELQRLPRSGQPLTPTAGFDGHPQALAWLEAERPNLLAAVQHAAEHGPHPIAYRLADALPEAVDYYQRALALNREAGWLAGQAANLGNLGMVYGVLGRLQQSADHTRHRRSRSRRGPRAPTRRGGDHKGVTARRAGCVAMPPAHRARYWSGYLRRAMHRSALLHRDVARIGHPDLQAEGAADAAVAADPIAVVKRRLVPTVDVPRDVHRPYGPADADDAAVVARARITVWAADGRVRLRRRGDRNRGDG
jgi:hypothetical protein